MQEGTSQAPGYPEETAGREPDVFAAQCPTRQLLDRVADKWSVLILAALGEEDMRFNALKRKVSGISQKMLSQTLRALERDGLVQRSVFPTIPVSVSYAITPLGCELLDALRSMIDWAQSRLPQVVSAQRDFDARMAGMG
ncbi:winged helix-turn-helix transcriptional regulator [Novosphingobium beihaiensis]|uniref:Helix-turn-helix transcriptional regulator n=1 Tax=Novosphingobium beihaiensis TaxID=2930389 RepID=A0ABT0BJJ9_9SPHN|nr:helix-turn-helix domain-containing protein [Novosphingobium beihaiensis]MCJ2185209.1 helix-turn-helix transcriptional regulator [Novosphingobium beihaiensis]